MWGRRRLAQAVINSMAYYERRLPHWHVDGARLFITWRLQGSFPSVGHPSVGQASGLSGSQSGRAFVAMDQALSSGPHWLSDERVARVMADTLRYGEEKLRLYRLRAWVLMSNHAHILTHPHCDTPRITKAIKNYSACQATAILGRTGKPFWLDESDDHWVRSPEALEKIVRYIEQTPVPPASSSSQKLGGGPAHGQARRPAPQR